MIIFSDYILTVFLHLELITAKFCSCAVAPYSQNDSFKYLGYLTQILYVYQCDRQTSKVLTSDRCFQVFMPCSNSVLGRLNLITCFKRIQYVKRYKMSLPGLVKKSMTSILLAFFFCSHSLISSFDSLVFSL